MYVQARRVTAQPRKASRLAWAWRSSRLGLECAKNPNVGAVRETKGHEILITPE
jgi:hypothetical protein